MTIPLSILSCFFFFFNHTATTEIYTLSLHDALPISIGAVIDELERLGIPTGYQTLLVACGLARRTTDRKSTRLNSSHLGISYAVFCLKKKKKNKIETKI